MEFNKLNRNRGAFLVCLTLIVIYDVINALEVIMEKAEIVEYNEKYVRNLSVNVVQYSRRTKPVMNLVATTLQTWDNNITMNFVYEEYIKNEYKPSFVGIQFKLCDLFDSPILNIKKVYGYDCPLQPGEKRFTNMTVHWQKVPNLFPFRRGRIIVTFKLKDTRETVVIGHLYAAFRENK